MTSLHYKICGHQNKTLSIILLRALSFRYWLWYLSYIMSSQELSLVLKIGYFIGHTPLPTKINERTRRRRIYHIVLFALLTFVLVKVLIYQRFYTNFSYIKMILALLSQLCIYGLSFYSMVVMNLSKKRSWERFLNSLNSTSHLIQSNEKSTVPLNFIVILLNLLHLATSGCVVYILCKDNIADYLSKNLIFHVEIYLQFFHKLLFYVIVNTILLRYRGLRNLLLDHAKATNKQTLHLVFIKRVEYTMRLLKVTVDIFNSMFAWPNFFIMSASVLAALSIIDYILFRNNQINMYEGIGIILIFLGWNLVLKKSQPKKC
jgi:hypothetical protein